MQALVIDRYGGPEVLSVRSVPEPEPECLEVVVEVVASALNRADLLQRMGLYPGPAAEYEIPGLEFAGRVIELGEKSERWETGDEIMGIVAGGAHAEKLVIHEDQAVRLPSGVSMKEAGSIPEAFTTAWDALILQGGLTAGGVALIHAGASGIGTAAIQLCRAVGAEALVTVSSGKRVQCLKLGASIAVDYQSGDWSEEVIRYTEGKGVDVVLDVVGGDYLNRNVDVLAVGGVIVQVGVMGGATSQFEIGKILPKRAKIIGTVLRNRSLEEKVALAEVFQKMLIPWFEDGSLRVIIDRRYSLSEAAEAHRYMESNANIGKIALDILHEGR
tara:strand:+ start:819 stop:1808 length:990 start_codon:yes stop_codon:yes gene_type:complete